MASDLRRVVLDTAANLVAANGVETLSLRDVARQAGVSHQAPYKHFVDREAVLAALATEGFDALADALDATASSGPVAAGCAYVAFAQAHPGHYRVMFRAPSFLRDGPAAASSARAFAGLQRTAAGLRGDPEVDAVLLWSLVHGLATLLLDGPLPLRGSTRPVDLLVREVLGRAVSPLVGESPKDADVSKSAGRAPGDVPPGG